MNASSPAAKLLWLCCFVFTAHQVAAQQAHGIMVDGTTREPLPGLRICAIGQNCCTLTDENGSFILHCALPVDSIHVQGLGYDARLEAVANPEISVTYGLVQRATELAGVQVTAFLSERSNAATPGSFGLVSGELLASTEQASLQSAMNTIPGVILDSRGYGGSQRISIRGSSLRAPFAIRNVRMYLGAIPLSSPDGSSPLEAIDLWDLDRMEVIKGPAGSTWGSGTGGVLLLRPRQATGGRTILGHDTHVGAYGFLRTASSVEISRPSQWLRVSHVYQQLDGYRAQEFNRKQQASLFGGWRTKDGRTYFAYLSHYAGHWGLPGALNAAEIEEDPRQARPFSLENNASLYRTRNFAGISQEWAISNRTTNTTAVYAMQTQKYNPYGTSAFSQGFKDEEARGAGGRTVFHHTVLKRGSNSVRLIAGGEYQFERFGITESDNVGGLPGEQLYHFDVDYHTWMAFAGAEQSIGRWYAAMSVSTGSTRHLVSGTAGGFNAANVSAHWQPAILPRFAVSYRADSLLWLHASISYGNSNPTAFEQVDYEHERFNLYLRPENGVNYEVGIKGTEYRSGIQAEVSVYRFLLSEAILPREVMETEPDTVIFTAYLNDGNTVQDGIEVSLHRPFAVGKRWSIVPRLAWTSYTYRFGRYEPLGENFEGKRLPGTPLHTLTSALTVEMEGRWSLDIFHYWFDRVPLDNENTAWTRSYHLLNARIRYTGPLLFGDRLGWTLSAGVNNALDANYTSFVQTNGTAGRYYNPSAPVNAYGNFSLRWMFR